MSSAKSIAGSGHAIRGVEIFSTGTHNGDPYTAADLDDMVSAAKELDFRPALKLGHTKDSPGAPAYGWAQNLRREGDRLLADFTDMDESVINALRNRRYDRVSSEVYFNLNRKGKKFRRALKAVALLGADVPAVADLKPLHKMEFAQAGEFERAPAFEAPLSVSDSALIASLSEQVAALTSAIKKPVKKFSLSKEQPTMKLAQFKAKQKELTAAIKAAAESEDEDKATKIAQFSEELGELNAVEIEKEEDPQVKTLAEQVKLLTATNAAAAARERDRDVREKLSTLTVPAFKPLLTTLMAYALEQGETKVKVYSADGKSEEKSLPEVVEGVIAQVNASASKLFKVFDDKGKGQKREEGSLSDVENPGDKIDELAQAYMVEHPTVKDYAMALEAVCQKHPDLAKAYAESQSGKAH